MDIKKEILKLQEEKEAFETEVFHWKSEIIKSTNKNYD